MKGPPSDGSKKGTRTPGLIKHLEVAHPDMVKKIKDETGTSEGEESAHSSGNRSLISKGVELIVTREVHGASYASWTLLSRRHELRHQRVHKNRLMPRRREQTSRLTLACS